MWRVDFRKRKLELDSEASKTTKFQLGAFQFIKLNIVVDLLGFHVFVIIVEDSPGIP